MTSALFSFFDTLFSPLSVKQKYAVCFCAGSIASLAFAPTYLVFVLLLSFPILLTFLLQSQSRKQAFLYGWWWGFGYFTLSLYWISFALTVNLDQFWWVMPFAIIGLPIILSLYHGLACLLTYWLFSKTSSHSKSYQVWLFVMMFSAMELARSYFFSGFPWNLVGHSWAWSSVFLQITSIVGLYGLSFLTVVIFSLPIIRNGFIISLVCLVGLFLYGTWRLDHAPKNFHDNLDIILIQPNIAQKDKWKPELSDHHIQTLVALSQKALQETSPETTKLIIWPETAIPFFFKQQPDRFAPVESILQDNVWLATGALDFTVTPGKPPSIYNALIFKNKTQPYWSRYEKSHLVPFGEYIPFREWLPLASVTGVDFSAGTGPVSVALTSTVPTFSPLICYESIFPGEVIRNTKSTPEWLLNITNDAWYGYSIGPFQHHDIAKIRSVEQGLPLVRVANTGFSSVVDSYGRNIEKTPLFQKSYVISKLPKISQKETLYAKNGWAFYLILIVIISLMHLFLNNFLVLFKNWHKN